ncbi:MAG: DUF11 domain-containing protein, partial [Gammaproteobacteria bacterium]|nr:DUF11 domain-containing protein [Gammaproteobacteria bacterium]
TVNFIGTPTCELTFNFNSNVSIATGQRLVIHYQARLEPGASVNGELLTNVASATQWFSGDGSNPRTTFTGLLTDGTPANNADNQDNFAVTVGLAPYYFQKTVTNLTTGATPAVTAVAGETLRYTLRVFNVSTTVTGVNISDNLDASGFDLNSYALVSSTAGAAVNFNAGSGLLTINGGDVAQGSELLVVFDIDTLPTLIDGATVSNQALLNTTSGYSNVVSDDPYVNGADDPTITPPAGDPTVVTIYRPGPLSKTNGPARAVIGETFTYTITVPATPVATPLYDVRILDTLGVDAAGNPTALDVSFVSATGTNVNGGSINWILSNTGTASLPVIEDLVSGIDIPANDQAIITITVRLNNSVDNQAGAQFYNAASYTYNRRNSDAATRTIGSGVTTTSATTIYEPAITSFTKTVDNPSPVAGQTVHYTVTMTAQSGANVSDVFDVTLIDQLPLGLQYVANSATVSTGLGVGAGNTITSTDVIGDGINTAQTLTWGVANADIDIQAGDTITFEYDVRVVLLTNLNLVNSISAQWTSVDGSNGFERNGTDGAGGVLNDYATAPAAATVQVQIPALVFEKSVINLTSGQNPGVNAQPGDTLQYTLYIQNTSLAALLNFSLQDELDALNVSPVFVPGSMAITSALPLGAVDNSNAMGGTNGTGVIDISNLDLTADDSAPGGTDEMTITFTAQLVSVIANSSQVLNQAGIISQATLLQSSDDPNIGGVADPTLTTITSAPNLEVFKISQDMTGDPNVLFSGDTLRYTITVKNIGNDNAVNAMLRDLIPANTTYVASSTYLNGVVVADVSGASALQAGMLINSPDTTTPGYLTADASVTSTNVATIIFDVTINAGVSDGVIISNQGFVSADDGGGNAIMLTPSDDPDTAILDDPTQDVVGSVPWLDAQKTVQIILDGTTPGIVDPGDTLRYTITITNAGGVAATNVMFTDAVPVNSTYVANSVYLNGLAAGQPDAGISPLVAGIAVSSTDLTTTSLPTAGNGVITAGGSATIIFDVMVDAVAPGTLISNQGIVSSNEQLDEPTDADGNDANGDQPTVVVVGNTQQLSITKQVFVVNGGVATAGGELEYVIRATNISSVPATNVFITDNLDLPVAGQKTYVPGSGLLNGLSTGVSYVAPIITADYGTSYGLLAPGAVVEFRFRVLLDAALPLGTTVINTATAYWNAANQNASASVSIDVGGTPGTINLNGAVWHDADFDEIQGGSETPLANWRIDLYQNSVMLRTTNSDVNGVYQFSGLLENYLVTDPVYELRFYAPGAISASASMGMAYSAFTNGQQRITDIRGTSGASLQNLDLPIQPDGMVYDSILRTPVANAVVQMVNALGTALPGSCFNDPNQQNQATLGNGYYKFELNFSQIECPANSDYTLNVYPPAGYIDSDNNPATPQSSAIIPASPGVYDAVSCPADAVITTTECEIQVSPLLPPTSVAPRTTLTDYYRAFTFGNVPREQIYNNHIPVDSETVEALGITKTSALVNVMRGQLVPYTITLNNILGVPLYDIDIVDRYPAGFKYVRNSARVYVNNVRASNDEEPQVNGLQMVWPNRLINNDDITVIKMLLVAGAGVGEGEYVNRVQAVNNMSNGNTSAEASATVRVVPDPTFDCSDIIGKVFNDKNLNGYADDGEEGIAGARVNTAQGLQATTDEYGRYHFTCAVIPNQDRGSNFIVKLDERSLPTGYRITSENPR